MDVDVEQHRRRWRQRQRKIIDEWFIKNIMIFFFFIYNKFNGRVLININCERRETGDHYNVIPAHGGTNVSGSANGRVASTR